MGLLKKARIDGREGVVVCTNPKDALAAAIRHVTGPVLVALPTTGVSSTSRSA
jgi:hypothetical protein